MTKGALFGSPDIARPKLANGVLGGATQRDGGATQLALTLGARNLPAYYTLNYL